MIYIREGHDITDDFLVNDNLFTTEWLMNATDNELSDLGIVVLEPIFPSLNENEIYNLPVFVDDYNAKTRTYSVIEKNG
jgi:hypothetical protein